MNREQNQSVVRSSGELSIEKLCVDVKAYKYFRLEILLISAGIVPLKLFSLKSNNSKCVSPSISRGMVP